MIGIICAMAEERDALLNLMDDVKIKYGKNLMYHGMPLDNHYYIGKIAKKDVVLTRSGVGKVYAAIVASNLIDRFKPDLLINLGCAGSLNEKVHVNDIVIADRCADWDVDVPGWQRSITSDKLSFACDEKGLKIAKKIKTKTKIHHGPIVSADEFIYKKSQVKEIKKYFNEALCGEMEGASIANTCYAYKVPVMVIRSISDEALINGNYKNFDLNLVKVCKTAAKYCASFISRY